MQYKEFKVAKTMTKSNPLVSVIMAAYNTQDYIEEAISSILGQTYQNFELICIDDSSTDSTQNRIKAMAANDNRIRLIVNEINQGAAGSRNCGIKKAMGKYIAIVDADDIADRDRLQRQVAVLEENSHIFLCSSDWVKVDKNNRYVKRCYTKQATAENIWNPTTMWRGDAGYLYRKKFKASEDYDLFLRMQSNQKEFFNIAAPLLRYRVRENSVSHQNVAKTIVYSRLAKHYKKQRNLGKKDDYDKLTDNDVNVLINQIVKDEDEGYLLGTLHNSIMERKYRQICKNIYQCIRKMGVLNKKLFPSYYNAMVSIWPIYQIKCRTYEKLSI